jgi:hypothetical protein
VCPNRQPCEAFFELQVLSEVTVKKSGEVRVIGSKSYEWVADFQISVHFGGETFESLSEPGA